MLDLNPVKELAIKIVEIAIKNGYLPLQGTKELVIEAIIRSLGVSIILVPTTPAALHPNPMHIVIICLPLVLALLKKPSILKASLGRNPKSSKKVKRGKNIAIGGSITDIIHVTVWKTPKTSIFLSHSGECIKSKKINNFDCIISKI